MTPEDLVLTPRGLRVHGRLIACSIGRGGITATKREGDGATPAGMHQIVGLLYRSDRIAQPAPWARPIRPGELWSDDPEDPAYNTLVRTPHRFSHERLRRSDRLYDLVLLTDWNWPHAEPGRGSAIFLHRWRKPGRPTEGCIAMSAGNLRWVAQRARPGTRLIVPLLAA
ncbi:L,D-transpeptidase family protein [Tranquillimonas alkanivorans]|uniref:L,D-transpeptidase catalytic domain n=1 Tax=Tranquillimonas alkanivorans TaxID=441119 RepID=A0A1I5W6Y8_9RHOB|nr:L,D-transpeptidase family protein [Tranquillimonas alkanivorans]SFQ15512.1 L,D-transpeptidase catalytic domain [Tranquillimonas alkanivorans]